MARKAQKRSPAERDAFLEQFRWLRKKSLKDDTKKRFFTKYVIGKTRVCQRHLCLPKARGQKPNHQQNEILAEFFQEIPKERSHYCLHSELLYIQGFPTLLLLFREFQRQNPGAILSRSKFTTCLSLHQQKLHAKSDQERRDLTAQLEQHQRTARTEEEVQVGFNQVLQILHGKVEEFHNVARHCFRIDADPAANLTFPQFGHEQVKSGDESFSRMHRAS